VEYRRWYYAAVTWADHSLGRALAKLEELGVANNTIVVFHSDHGYQLGELNQWSKKTDTELAVHVPLLIRVPWKQSSVGQRTAVKAELVDVYRTLADLAGLDGVQDSVQGTSLAGAFDAPANPPRVLAEKAAFSQIGRCDCHFWDDRNATMCGANACVRVAQDSARYNFMGYTMRTQKWRYTAWVQWDHEADKPDWAQPVVSELFDLTMDTGRDFDFDGYSVNLANRAEYHDVVQQLQGQLKTAASSWEWDEAQVV